jgi:hypothetical protein
VPSPHRGRLPEQTFEERDGRPASPAPPTRQTSQCTCLHSAGDKLVGLHLHLFGLRAPHPTKRVSIIDFARGRR